MSVQFKAGDNDGVRRLFAAILLVLFVSLNAMDGICCPDGCTHGQSASQPRKAKALEGICALCLGGMTPAAAHEVAPGGVVSDDMDLPPLAHHLDPASEPVERPPRS